MKKNLTIAVLTISLIAALILLCTPTDAGRRAGRLARERDARAKISQQFGLVRVNSSDQKRYISFAYRAKIQENESIELLDALASAGDIPEIAGVHLDGIRLTRSSLIVLTTLPSLERLTIADSGLSAEDVAWFRNQRPSVDVWTEWH